MKRVASCLLVLVCAFCLSPLGDAETTSPASAENIEASVHTKETPEDAAKSNDAALSTTGADGKESGSGETTDVTFASIHSKGLTVADGTAVERTQWVYEGTTRYPVKKKILRAEESEVFRYDEDGRELSIERYERKILVSKTENIYNGDGKLVEQTITAGKNIDRSVWEFVGDKAVSQTKYRNGKKNAFIELHNTPHIVHLYVDDKEVYVGEEQ